MNTICHLKKAWFLVVVLGAAAVVTCVSRVGHADYLPVYGGPTYSPATGGYLALDPANANYTPVYVSNGGIAAAPVSKGDSDGNFLGMRGIRWSATSPPTELGGDPNSNYVTGINSSGTVIGTASAFVPNSPATPYLYRPARWDASSTAATILDIPQDGDARENFWTSPFDINDAGTAVGSAHKVVLDEFGRRLHLGFRAARWDAGGTALTELGHLGTSNGIDGHDVGYTGVRANAINAAGAAAGYATKFYADGSSILRAVRWDASAVAATELQAPATAPNQGTYTTVAKAINDAGIAVGNGEYNRHPAIRWDAAGNATELGEIAGFPGGYISDSPKALNNAGTAVGRTMDSWLGTRAVRWDGSSTAATELGHLGTYTDGFTNAYAMAINESGTAVGRALAWFVERDDGAVPYHAVYWAADNTTAIDMNTLIDPTSGWELEQALDISDTGWIVGVGRFDPDGPGGQDAYPRHFLMHVPATVVPEPATVLLFGIAICGLGMALRSRKVLTVGIVCLIVVETRAADFGAQTSGNWNSSSTWTPAGVPGLNDSAYIGSTIPGGAVGAATVNLTANQQARDVYLGNGANTSGTLNLGDFNLFANRLYLGFNGGTGAVTRGAGSVNVGRLYLSASTLAMNATDETLDLFLDNGSSATTAVTANVSSEVQVKSGSSLTLGADLSARGILADNSYNIEISGENSSLDAQGHTITTHNLSVGWEVLKNGDGIPTFREPGHHVVQLLNRGDLVVDQELYVANQDFNLTPTDQVWGFVLGNASTHFGPAVAVQRLQLEEGSTATTTAVGNITYGAFVSARSTLTLGANLNVGRVVGNEFVAVVGNSTLDPQGHKITAWGLSVQSGGANTGLLNRGDIDVFALDVANQDFNLTATDQVSIFGLANCNTSLPSSVGLLQLHLQDAATARTSAAGNVTQRVQVWSGSTLILGADLNVSEYVQVLGTNSTIDAQGHNITANALTLVSEAGDVQLQNRGDVSVANLRVAKQTLDLRAADQVTDFTLINGSSSLGAISGINSLTLFENSATTTGASENLIGSVRVFTGSTLTLGADLAVSGDVEVGDDSTLNAQGHKITADALSLRGSNVQLGELNVANLALVAQSLNLSAADRVTNLTLAFDDQQGGSTVSTASAGNVTGYVTVDSYSTLTLGADLAVTGNVAVGGVNSTLDAQGYNITATNLDIGYSSVDPGMPNVSLLNDGAVTLSGSLVLFGGVQVELRGGNDTMRGLALAGSHLMIKSAATGFTLTGNTADYLVFDDGALTFELNGLQPGWVFRWANPDDGDHIADLSALIDQNLIKFRVINGGQYDLVSQNGYTYIVQPVPEPASLALVILCMPLLVGWCARRSPKHGGDLIRSDESDKAPYCSPARQPRSAHGLSAEVVILS